MLLETLDTASRLLTVVLALGVIVLAVGTLLVGRQLLADSSVRSLLRRSAAVTLQDPNVTFDRHADRNPKTKEVLVPFIRYRVSVRLLLQGVVVAAAFLIVKLLLLLFRFGLVASAP